MANIIRNYLYGKPGQKDFTEADLPTTRIALFRQVLNVRKGRMMGLNLLYLLIWVPAIFWTFLNITSFMVVNVPTSDELRQAGLNWLMLLFPMIAITGPFNAGISQVTRRWARDEHSFPYADFWAAVKENWKQALLFSTLDGLVPLLFYICMCYYTDLTRQSNIFLLPLGISVLGALLWFLAAPIVPVLIVSYRQGFWGILRNAFLMTLAQLPRALAIRLITLAIPILTVLGVTLFPNSFLWITGIAAILYMVFLLAFNRLIWASFANFLGEKYLNPKIEGARTDIGLRPKDKR